MSTYIPKSITYIYGNNKLILSDTKALNNFNFVISANYAEVSDTLNINLLTKIKNNFNISENKYYEYISENKPFNELYITDNVQFNNEIDVVILGRFVIRVQINIIADIIKNCNIRKGVVYDSEFIWVVYNSNIKLVRIDSDIYNDVIKKQNLYTLKNKISNKNLKIGYFYSNSRGTYLYCGKINTANITVFKYSMFNTIRDDITYINKCAKIITSRLWLKVDDLDYIYKNGIIKFIHEKCLTCNVEIVNNKITYDSKYKSIEVPNNIIDLIREEFIEIYENSDALLNHTNYVDLKYVVMVKYPEKIKLDDTLRSIWNV